MKFSYNNISTYKANSKEPVVITYYNDDMPVKLKFLYNNNTKCCFINRSYYLNDELNWFRLY